MVFSILLNISVVYGLFMTWNMTVHSTVNTVVTLCRVKKGNFLLDVYAACNCVII